MEHLAESIVNKLELKYGHFFDAYEEEFYGPGPGKSSYTRARRRDLRELMRRAFLEGMLQGRWSEFGNE